MDRQAGQYQINTRSRPGQDQVKSSLKSPVNTGWPGLRAGYLRQRISTRHLRADGDLLSNELTKLTVLLSLLTSKGPVPLHPVVLESLHDWKRQSLYKNDGDFLFPSIRLNGTKPLSPDSLLKKAIRPALIRAGIEGKIIGWHNFRHTLGTLLRALGTDIKVAQDLLRHANSRTTLDIYTHAVSQQKRNAEGG